MSNPTTLRNRPSTSQVAKAALVPGKHPTQVNSFARMCIAGGMALGLMLSACGGSGSSGDVAPSPNAVAGGSVGTNTQSTAEFIAWWIGIDSNVYNQAFNVDKSTYLTAQGGGDELANDLIVAGEGGDAFVLWGRSSNYNGDRTYFARYSASDIARQRNTPGFDYNIHSLFVRGVDGAWGNAFLSHKAHYLAGAWASNNLVLAGGQQRWLSIIDLTVPEGSDQQVWHPPGGETEKVDRLQWISDTQFILRNQSGRKFRITATTGAFEELKATPATFNGYSIVSEFPSPDGQKFGGLMSKDGGKTHEVWTANLDYSDLRQITNAQLKLELFDWVGSSKYLMFGFFGVPGAVQTNLCTHAFLNANTASMLTAPQLVASPSPGNLPCAFTASLP